MTKLQKNLISILLVEIMVLTILAMGLIIKLTFVSAAESDDVVETTTIVAVEISITEEEPEEEYIETVETLEEKYSSVFNWQKYTGDFGVEQLYFLNSQCEKYEIPMELMLAIICTESSFNSDAKAKTSSASGYCQIIKSTAKWIYEDKLKYGTYDVENHREIMTTNWRLNMEISCRLIKLLYTNNGHTWENAVKKYYGSTNPEENNTYLNTVNKNMYDLFEITTINL